MKFIAKFITLRRTETHQVLNPRLTRKLDDAQAYLMISLSVIYLFLAAPVLGLFKSTVNPIFTSIMSRVVGADEQGMY